MTTRNRHPNWDHLYEVAAGQEGLFTTQQAAEAGYSPQLLVHHMRTGRVLRLRRGVYRLIHFPAGEHEDLVAVWLWSERQGIFSHQTALALHGLSDVLPSKIHLMLPTAWRRRRFRVPPSVALHYADMVDSESAWFGTVPVTSPGRTLRDCAAAKFSLDQLRQAVIEAIARGIVAKADVVELEQMLASSGGSAA